MKLIFKRKTYLICIRNVILVLTFLCLIEPYVDINSKTELSSRKLHQQNASIAAEYTFLKLIPLDFQDTNVESLKRRTVNLNKSLGMQMNDTENNHGAGEITFTRKLPDAIIIGVKKCGTRALLEYLRLHPNVRGTGPEPHFFDRYYHLGMEWYRRKMPKSSEGQLTIEKTPRYFVTEEVPERIYNMSRNIKLILVVRNPVTRAISDFTQAVSKGEYNETVTFRSRAIRRNGTVNKKWSAINIGLYSYHLKQWLQFFPSRNIHIVDGEKLMRNPIYELNFVQDFLKLDRKIPGDVIYMNATKGFPCIKKQRKTLYYKCFRNSKGRQHPHTDKETLSMLHNFYKPYNDDFFKITGKHFDWK